MRTAPRRVRWRRRSWTVTDYLGSFGGVLRVRAVDASGTFAVFDLHHRAGRWRLVGT